VVVALPASGFPKCVLGYDKHWLCVLRKNAHAHAAPPEKTLYLMPPEALSGSKWIFLSLIID
jgi:hypothetical protein